MPCSVNPRARGAAYGSTWELHKEIVPSVKARAQGAAVSWSRLFVLLFAIILVVPVSAPTSVDAASLQDQIAAAKERQAALTQSIAKSERLVSQLQSEEAQTKRDLDQTTDGPQGHPHRPGGGQGAHREGAAAAQADRGTPR